MKINHYALTLSALLFFSITSSTLGQETPGVKLTPKDTTIVDPYLLLVPTEVKRNTVILSKNYEGNVSFSDPDKLLELVLNNEFSRLITGNSLSGIGNYASVKTENNTLNAAGNWIRNGKVYTANVSASISDNIANIFTNTKLNSNVTLGFTFHKIINNEIAINASDITAINNETRKIKEKHEKKYWEIKNFEVTTRQAITKKEKEIKELTGKIKKLTVIATTRQTASSAIQKLEVKLSSLQSRLKTVQKEINTIREAEGGSASEIASNNQKLILLIDALNTAKNGIASAKKEKAAKAKELKGIIQQEKDKDQLIAGHESKIATLKYEIGNLKEKMDYHENNYGEIRNAPRNETWTALKDNLKKVNEIKATDISIKWFSFGAEGTYQSFNLFDGTRNLDDQVYSEKDWVPSLLFSFSGYSNRPLIGEPNPFEETGKHIKYYSVGFKGTFGNNLSSLELTEVRTTTLVQPTRELIKRENAYVGTFEEEEFSGQLYADYYQFVGNKNNVGFHGRATIDMGGFRPVSSLRFGVLFPFVDSSDVKSSVNLEVFFGLNDIFNKASDKSLLGRNVFGIQASLPLNFNLI